MWEATIDFLIAIYMILLIRFDPKQNVHERENQINFSSVLASIVLLYKEIAYIMYEIIEILNMGTKREMRM